MINSVTVHDLAQAKEINCGNRQTNHNAWISATDIDDLETIKAMVRRNKSRKIPHLALYFMDISEEDSDYITYSMSGPSEEDVRKIVEFIKKLIDSPEVYNLGVNCFAGVSRSSAIALIARYMKGDTPAEAVDAVERVRPMMHPNLRILRLASEIWKDKSLYSYVKKWLVSNKGEIYVPKGGWHW